MTETDLLRCDGCGQAASSGHLARRLQRLEWTTRYRPIHIGTVLLGASAPQDDAEVLYAEGGEFAGEAQCVLAACGVASAGRSWQEVLTEFQRGGFLLTYALECPLESGAAIQPMLESRLPALLTRIRRSLRPKRVVPISRSLEPLLAQLTETPLGCAVLLDDGKAFSLDGNGREEAIGRLRGILGAAGR